MQRQRYTLFCRSNGMYYAQDSESRKQTSLATKDRAEAVKLLGAKNDATAQPILNVAMARTYLSAKSPELMTRTWGRLIELMAKGYTGPTAKRWKRFQISAPMRLLADFPIYQTEATHFLEVLNHERAGVSTNVWLRILHHRAFRLIRHNREREFRPLVS